jgi:hypothetical protein
MYKLNLPPLANEDALYLAQQLLIGENIATTSITEVGNGIVEAVNGIPFYIHHVVDLLNGRSSPVDILDINTAITNALEEVNIWELGDYEERIQKYYLESNYKLALLALDKLAISEKLLSFTELLDLAKAEIDVVDKEDFRKVLKLLEQDHYVSREVGGGYYFRFQLVKKYWQIQRLN